jgi:hypothetical protein
MGWPNMIYAGRYAGVHKDQIKLPAQFPILADLHIPKINPRGIPQNTSNPFTRWTL